MLNNVCFFNNFLKLSYYNANKNNINKKKIIFSLEWLKIEWFPIDWHIFYRYDKSYIFLKFIKKNLFTVMCFFGDLL